MPNMKEILSEFSRLRNVQKIAQLANYSNMLNEAYLAGERKIVFSGGGALGLQNAGGLLLGMFLQEHPDIEEVNAPGNMFYNPSFPHVTDGFHAFITGLTATKKAGKLRVLDLSDSEYRPDQLKELAEKVIYHHPSLTTLNLNATGLHDQHLEKMIPYLEAPNLQIIQLRRNHLGDMHVSSFATQLRRCPALNLIDLTTNDISLKATTTLKSWLQENHQLFIRYPIDRELMILSSQNQFNYFIPSKISVMAQQFNMLVEQLARFEIRIDAFPEAPEDEGAREQIRMLEDRLQSMANNIDQHKQNMLQQLLQQDIVQTVKIRTMQKGLAQQTVRIDALITEVNDTHRHLGHVQGDLTALQTAIESTQVQLQEIETRLALTESEDRGLCDAVRELRGIVAQHDESLDELQEAFRMLQEVQERLSALPESIWQSSVEIAALSEEDQSYAYYFKKIVVSMHMAAMVISTGLIRVNISGSMGKASKVLNTLSGAAPLGLGMGLKILAYCLQAADQKIIQQRMERLSNLCAPDQVASLSDELSSRLVHCVRSIHNPVKDHHIKKLLSTAGEIIETFAQDGFYGALTQSIETAVIDPIIDEKISTETTLSLIEERAKQDAQVLLAAVAQKGAPRIGGSSVNIDKNLLFLYAVPLVTVVDNLYLKIVDHFCQQQSWSKNDVYINHNKRNQFYARITESWQQHAFFVSSALEDDSEREALTTSFAQGLFSARHVDGAVGIFHVGKKSFSTLSHRKIYHAGWNPTVLKPSNQETGEVSVVSQIMATIVAIKGR